MIDVRTNLTADQAAIYNSAEVMAFRSNFQCLAVAGGLGEAFNRSYWERESRAFTLENAHRYFEFFKA